MLRDFSAELAQRQHHEVIAYRQLSPQVPGDLRKMLEDARSRRRPTRGGATVAGWWSCTCRCGNDYRVDVGELWRRHIAAVVERCDIYLTEADLHKA